MALAKDGVVRRHDASYKNINHLIMTASLYTYS